MTTAATKTREIPVELLQLSPEETRKTIDQAALAELAKSIETSGVIEPLLARTAAVRSDDGERSNAFEIVSGQRRWLAAKLAGKKTVPCNVREMSDDEARRARITSNLQRENLPPMEEAEAYGKLLEAPGATIETVAAELGKSASYIGRRVQLLEAIEPVREALKAGAIEVGHALELARLDGAMQRQLLTRMQVGATLIEPEDVEDEEGESGTCRFCGCTDDDACEGGCSWANEEQTICNNPKCLERFREETQQQNSPWRKTHYSVVELRREIEDSSYRDLSEAPFPLVADLHPMPCIECPKRAGNSALLFDDCAQDTCTDRPCFNRKVNAWIDVELAEAKAAKRVLLKLTSNYSSDKTTVQVGDYYGARALKAQGECESGEEGIWIEGRNAGRRAFICRNANCKTHHAGSRSSYSSGATRAPKTEKEKAARRRVLDQVKETKAYRVSLVAAIAAASVDAKGAEALNVDVCCALLEKTNSQYAAHLAKAIGWDEDVFGWNSRGKLRAKVAALPAGQRLLIARLSEEAGELSVTEFNASGKCEDLEKIARLVGVDPKKIRAAGAKPTVAEPAKAVSAKTAAKPAKKKQFPSAAARKRIAEAQKKRWASAKKGGKR